MDMKRSVNGDCIVLSFIPLPLPRYSNAMCESCTGVRNYMILLWDRQRFGMGTVTEIFSPHGGGKVLAQMHTPKMTIYFPPTMRGKIFPPPWGENIWKVRLTETHGLPNNFPPWWGEN